VQVKYTLFTAAGVPVRAPCTVALEEIAGDPPKQNPTSGGLVPRRVHVLIEGETLAGIAYNEYGNASLWRAVAAANRIDDPMRLRPGTSVLLPAVNELPSGALQGNPAEAREVLRGAR
jgi:nucleoid-associated protein YgaU